MNEFDDEDIHELKDRIEELENRDKNKLVNTDKLSTWLLAGYGLFTGYIAFAILMSANL